MGGSTEPPEPPLATGLYGYGGLKQKDLFSTSKECGGDLGGIQVFIVCYNYVH